MNRENEMKQFIQRLKNLEKHGKEKFQIEHLKSFQEIDEMVKQNIGISEELKPAACWFVKEHFDDIYDMINEVQTKTEDSIKSSKRIFKVWNPDVLQAHNVRFTIEYVDMLSGSMKYLKTKFWRYRKHLKTLFIEDENLFDDNEIKLLKKNVSIMTENDNWLFFKKRRIKETLGENYKEKETDFIQIRKNYDKFHCWLTKQPDKRKINKKEFSSYCEFVRELEGLQVQKFMTIVIKNIPDLTKEAIYSMSFEKLEQRIEEYLKLSEEKNGVSEYRIKQYGFKIKENPTDLEQPESVKQAIDWILENEYSISVKELAKQCCSLFGQSRVTAKLKGEIEQVIQDELPEHWYLENEFIISKDSEKRQFYIAKENEKRDISMVSNQEMLYGILKVIKVEREITLDDISKLFSRLLGYPRRTSKVNSQVEAAIKQLKEAGKIVRKSGGWCLLES